MSFSVNGVLSPNGVFRNDPSSGHTETGIGGRMVCDQQRFDLTCFSLRCISLFKDSALLIVSVPDGHQMVHAFFVRRDVFPANGGSFCFLAQARKYAEIFEQAVDPGM